MPDWLFKRGEKVRLTEAVCLSRRDLANSHSEHRVMVLIEILNKPVAMRVVLASLRKAI